MASNSSDDLVTLVLADPGRVDTCVEDEEFFISTADILSWDLSIIVCYHTVRVQTRRSRLCQESSYFHGLLSGSFSESCLNCISIQWDLKIALNVLKCIHGFQLDIAPDNFLPLFEGALYFGVERLLSKCKTWFLESVVYQKPDTLLLDLDDIIDIWKFGLDHANDFLPNLCVDYLARNFMWARRSKFFGVVPHNLLMLCIIHPHLTIDSEMHLSDALSVWLDAKGKWLECSNSSHDESIILMQQVRVTLLPLWYPSGARKSGHFSKLADDSIASIFRLMKIPSASLVDILEGDCLMHLRIRLTKYSERLDLSGCPQLTASVLLLSLLSNLYQTEDTWRKKVKDILINIEDGKRDQFKIPHDSLPILSFEAVKEVDISKCPRLNIKAAIECFSKSFPFLRKLRAAYLLDFRAINMQELVRKCLRLSELDLTVDNTPVVPGQVTVVCSNTNGVQPLSNNCSTIGGNFLYSRPLNTSVSNILRLTVEGRSDIRDSDLLCISRLCKSLHYLNIKGCSALTDVCISEVLQTCKNLHSIIVCNTLFGKASILTLCTSIDAGKGPNTLASNLQTLHMGGCNGVDETRLACVISQAQKLKSLCLRDTSVEDLALSKFSGSSLGMLDVSNTKISRVALVRLIRGNPGLRCLKARGCKNLVQPESNSNGADFSSLYFGSGLDIDLFNRCKLEEIEMGWGLSYFSLVSLRHAITSLRMISVGLGGSLSEAGLKLLPSACPLLESIIIHFQVISDDALSTITATMKHLKELVLSYCLGDITISSFKLSLPKLRKLRLERVSNSMTNEDLCFLTQNIPNLIELSLVGCTLLNSDSQKIISHGWPGLIVLHLEDCGGITTRGVSSILDCVALEDLLLRHNGRGIKRNFVLDAASKLPVLRLIALDVCDASDGDFDVPDDKDKCFLSILKIARCKSHRCALDQGFRGFNRSPVHNKTLVMTWTSIGVTTTVVKERL